jgi:ABC-type Fe3+ transport system permease subunit
MSARIGASSTPRQVRTSAPILRCYYAVLIALLYLPIAILVLFSFNANQVLAFPLQGFTWQWYGNALATPTALTAARNSVLVATGSSFVATLLAAMVAILVARYSFRGKQLLVAISVLPLIVPYIVLAVALLLLFAALDVNRSLWTVGIAHTVIALPYALLIIVARLGGVSPFLEEAAADLGADYLTTLRDRGRLAGCLHCVVRRVRARALSGRRRPDAPGLHLRPAPFRQPPADAHLTGSYGYGRDADSGVHRGPAATARLNE